MIKSDEYIAIIITENCKKIAYKKILNNTYDIIRTIDSIEDFIATFESINNFYSERMEQKRLNDEDVRNFKLYSIAINLLKNAKQELITKLTKE